MADVPSENKVKSGLTSEIPAEMRESSQYQRQGALQHYKHLKTPPPPPHGKELRNQLSLRVEDCKSEDNLFQSVDNDHEECIAEAK